jgi:hypothetical protein
MMGRRRGTVLAQIVVVHRCCYHAFNVSVLHSSQLSESESCTVQWWVPCTVQGSIKDDEFLGQPITVKLSLV